MEAQQKSKARSTREYIRRRLGAFFVDGAFYGLSRLGKMLPNARPERHQAELLRDIPYLPSGRREHLLDVYRPTKPPHGATRYPIVLYIHGGGFRILSKDTHWIMALSFARRGFLVFNINYRLAPRYPYPAAMEDVCRAFAWVVEHAHEYGGDTSRLILAGESAGANLVTSLALCCSEERPEPWTREVFAQNLVPRAVVAACGMHQVSDTARFLRRRPMPRFIVDRIEEVSECYLGEREHDGPGGHELADPLLILEQRAEKARPFARPLPPFFASVGTRDPLLDDTRRLKTALDQLGARCEARYYPGEIHAFHALFFRENARKCWKETFSFLEDCLR